MTDIKVDFNFSPEILKGATEAQDEVEKILEEVKNELINSSGTGLNAVELTLAGLEKN
jgi:hypothetical protein